MRAGLIRTLLDVARVDSRIFLLVGDVGYHLIEPFAEEFPSRFINVGIAEQNMIGVAAGLAMSGKIVFVYSLANFPTIRCLEQIRNDVCYHRANVKIVASGAGLSYGALGVTHHVTEDMAIMRALPNMVVIAPGDPVEAALATRAAAHWSGPCYLRLGKTGDPLIHQTTPCYEIGKAITIREGKDITLIASGGILVNVVKAAKQLEVIGIEARVLSMHTVKPLDVEAIMAAVRETNTIITVEEHNILGGLGGAVAEIVAESGVSKVTLKRLGLKDSFCYEVGSQTYLHKYFSLSAEDIASEATILLERL